jgi:hypothetical protein
MSCLNPSPPWRTVFLPGCTGVSATSPTAADTGALESCSWRTLETGLDEVRNLHFPDWMRSATGLGEVRICTGSGLEEVRAA